MVNPRSGHELEVAPGPQQRRRVVVVGGGVAGMEAALTAAAMNDEVILFEAVGIPGWPTPDGIAVYRQV